MASYTLDAAKKSLPGGPHRDAVLLPALLAAGQKVVTQGVFYFNLDFFLCLMLSISPFTLGLWVSGLAFIMERFQLSPA